MKLNKPLSEYTIAGLLFVGAQTRDFAVKAAVLEELRERRRQTAARKAAAEHNRIEREKLYAELEIEGLRSKDQRTRRQANRDLYATMQDRAFELVDIPEGLPPVEAVKVYNREMNAKAKELYTAYKQAHKTTAVKQRREQVREERREYRERQIAERRRRDAEAAARRNARFPLVGIRVYYTGTDDDGKQIGEIRGFSYRHSSCTFAIRILAPDGSVVNRAFSAVEPVEDIERFRTVREPFLKFERMERLVRERDELRRRMDVFQARLDELDAVVVEYLDSDFRRDWLTVDEVARNLAPEMPQTTADPVYTAGALF